MAVIICQHCERENEIPDGEVDTGGLVLVKPEADVEIMVFYTQALQLRDYAEARVIITNDDLKPANEDLNIIRTLKKAMEEKRKDYLRPFQDHVKETNEAYKTLMEPIEQADRITEGKMLEFSREQKRKRLEAKAIEAEKLELAKRETELNGEHTVDLTPWEYAAGRSNFLLDSSFTSSFLQLLLARCIFLCQG